MALGFLAFLEVLFVLAFGLRLDLHWSTEAVEGLQDPMRLLRVGLPIGLLTAGAILTLCQAAVLRGMVPRAATVWILTGPAGFALVLIFVWPLSEMGIWGRIPGPVEPLGIVGGGLLATTTIQWWLLARNGVRATRPLLLWIVGLPLGMALSIGVLLVAIEVFQVGVPWAAEVSLYGVLVGGTAAAVSGRSLYEAILQGDSHRAMEPG